LDPWLASLWVTLREQIPLPVGLQDPTPGDTGLGFLPPPPVSITEFYLLWSNFRVCNFRELAAGAFLQICVDVCAI